MRKIAIYPLNRVLLKESSKKTPVLEALMNASLQSCRSLSELWRYVGDLNKTHFSDNNLMPIVGGGQAANPKVMFVFINPTARNISSDPNWKGLRYPFIGTKSVWRVFHRAGFLTDSLISRIEENSGWSVEFADELEGFLRERGLYLTNLVKWTGPDGSLPDRNKINIFMPLLIREVEIVSPKYLVTFGSIPFKYLTGKTITLGDYYDQVVRRGLRPEEMRIGSVKAEVIPCYFPVGRGNPQRAVEILKLVNLLN